MNIGIDIGTYSIRIAILKESGPETILDETQNREMLNIISYNKIRKVGNLAIESTKKNSENTIFSITRLIQKTNSELKEEINFCNFSKKNDKIIFEIQIDTKKNNFSIEELLASIFSQIKENISKISFKEEENIINICYPQNYLMKEKLILLNSSFIGGFKNINLISEEMAIINQFLEIKKNSVLPKNLIFIDFGYSKIRIYYVLFINNIVQSIYSDFIEIGVFDFDRNLFNFITNKFFFKYQYNILDQKKLKYRLLKEIQKKRKILSSNQKVEICLENFLNEIDLIENIDRKQFEVINIELINRIKIFFLKSMNLAQKNGFNINDISEIQKLGGGSRMPFFEILVKKIFFGKNISKNFNLEEAMSKGLCIFPLEKVIKNFCKIEENIFLKVFDEKKNFLEILNIFPKNSFFGTKQILNLEQNCFLEIYSENEKIFDLIIFSDRNLILEILLNNNGLIEILNLDFLKKNSKIFEIKNFLGLKISEILNLREKEFDYKKKEKKNFVIEKYIYDLQSYIYNLRNEIQNEKNLLKTNEKNHLLNLLKNYEIWTNKINLNSNENQIKFEIDKFENEIFFYKKRQKNLKLFKTLNNQIEEYIFFIRNFDFNNSEILIEGTEQENSKILKSKIICLNILKRFKNLQNNFNLDLLADIDIENDLKLIEENIDYLKSVLRDFNNRSVIY